MAGVWRYYSVLYLGEQIKEKLESNFDKIVNYLKNEGVISEEQANELISNYKKGKISCSYPKTFLNSIFEILKLKGNDKKEEREKIGKVFYEYLDRDLFNGRDFTLFEGNRFIGIKCAGQDDAPNINIEDTENEDKPTGHCGKCIVCKSFGFSKKNLSWQGLVFFSDLEILFFPVFTYKGTKWITTKKKLEKVGINSKELSDTNKILVGEENEKNT